METYEVIVYEDKTVWYQGDLCHWVDGPAVECANGNKAWYQEGKLHRLDGPAIEWADGSKSWYQDDKLHRVDGPAIEWSDGDKYWYLEGIEYTEEEFRNSIGGKVVEIEGKKYKMVEVE